MFPSPSFCAITVWYTTMITIPFGFCVVSKDALTKGFWKKRKNNNNVSWNFHKHLGLVV